MAKTAASRKFGLAVGDRVKLAYWGDHVCVPLRLKGTAATVFGFGLLCAIVAADEDASGFRRIHPRHVSHVLRDGRWEQFQKGDNS